MTKRGTILVVFAVLVVLALAACQSAPPSVPAAECPVATECPAPSEAAAPAVNVPYEAAWEGSAHNDTTAEAFNHWNEDDPAEIPTDCARCHSTSGYQDYVGADGSAAGAVDAAAAIGQTITCEACHNDQAAALKSVTFPSGAEITGLGPSARCMVCHQGRASGQTVQDAVDTAGLTDSPDTVSADLRFVNIHYFAAAASLFGSEAKAGYQYEGKAYQIRNGHVDGYTECIECHNQHTLEVRVEECSVCHEGTSTVEDLKNTRMSGSLADYDGDGDTEEGMYYELEGLREMLMTAMQAYATDVAGTSIAYSETSYPYFFIDGNSNGTVDDDEAVSDNAFNAWTPRLLEAAYNFQVNLKDPGAFAHNPKYHVALLYDSVESLNEGMGSAVVDLSTASRNDPGHFDGTAEAFRHWDEDGAVPGTCSRCHSSDGLPVYLAEGVTISEPTANGFKCLTCHESLGGDWPRRAAADATFPSGATVTFGEGADANLCIQCHQGRESTVSVDRALSGLADDTPDESIRFRNIHYFAAGATLFGTEVKGAYEYAGKTYVGQNVHVEGFNQCTQCHNVHALTVNTTACAGCHGTEEVHDIRISTDDFDGDGDATEGLYNEFATMHDALYAAIQAYASEKAGVGIIYNPAAYPYFFADTDGNGEINGEEGAYATWTPRLLRAAYNYQYGSKDPGAFAHNGKYLLQITYDSLQDIGGAAAATGMTRPAAAP
jgi:hypothetical protein